MKIKCTPKDIKLKNHNKVLLQHPLNIIEMACLDNGRVILLDRSGSALHKQERKMSATGHGGLSPRALSRTHAGKAISRNGAKTFKSLRIVCQMMIGTKA